MLSVHLVSALTFEEREQGDGGLFRHNCKGKCLNSFLIMTTRRDATRRFYE